jgi:hypothetical protein
MYVYLMLMLTRKKNKVKQKQHCIKIRIGTLKSPYRSFYMCASSQHDMKQWLNALSFVGVLILPKEVITSKTFSMLKSVSETEVEPICFIGMFLCVHLYTT